ncbi:NUDIX hydrolase domain-like protein [Mycena amicta]|nr:NUDIX hydrolase domain-like protein [Mycena amicta]
MFQAMRSNASKRFPIVQPTPPPPPPPMSNWSTAAVPDSIFADDNFLLGAGMVIFQQNTHNLKVVLCYEKEKKYWFLPKGRKDVGESLEEAALREAYEESGYRVEPLPLLTQTHAPSPPSDEYRRQRPNCEPIMITMSAYPRRRFRNGQVGPPGEYLSFWYVGTIPIDAVRQEGTGMPDEINYESHLLSPHEAYEKLRFDGEAKVVNYAVALYNHTSRVYAEQQRQDEEEEMQRAAAVAASTENDGADPVPSSPMSSAHSRPTSKE